MGSKTPQSTVSPGFTTKQKAQYRDVLGGLRDLIHDLTQNASQEQLAS
jgi:hypothetical protein